jgi:hypothetical protein
MTDFYSDHWTTTVSGTSIDDPRIKAPVGTSGSILRYKRATVTLSGIEITGDVVRFFSVKSAERVCKLFISTTGEVTTMQLDFGIVDTMANGGADVSGAFYAAGLATEVQKARVDIHSLNLLAEEKRGLPLWQNLGLSVDPRKTYDVAGTVSNAFGPLPREIVLEMYYTSAGR